MRFNEKLNINLLKFICGPAHSEFMETSLNLISAKHIFSQLSIIHKDNRNQENSTKQKKRFMKEMAEAHPAVSIRGWHA